MSHWDRSIDYLDRINSINIIIINTSSGNSDINSSSNSNSNNIKDDEEMENKSSI